MNELSLARSSGNMADGGGLVADPLGPTQSPVK